MALVELTIRNFAIIKHLELELDEGLTIVTGETGAGKSIVIEALNLLLGSRAGSEMIRHGEEQCEITALFTINHLSEVRKWLRERDLISDEDEKELHTCLIRRVVRLNKPTRCYVNDQPTTLQTLKELGLMLVALHGQHEHQSLLRVSDQRRILDQFAGHDSELQSMASLAATINRLRREFNKVAQSKSDNDDRLELLAFQLNELNEADLREGEFEQLEVDYARLANAQGLLDGLDSAVNRLNDDEQTNLSSELGRVLHDLTGLADVDPQIAQANEMLHTALAQLDEGTQVLSSVRSKIEQDPERLNEIEARRDLYINLARKHRCAETQLVAKHAQLQTDFSVMDAAHERPEQLEKEINELSIKYQDIATQVSIQRQEVAQQLSATITEQMQDLGMKGGKLKILVEPRIEDQTLISENGIDQIEFQVSSNFGSPFKSLSKTASGGELSRISLAIQVVISAKSDTPTLVFDEVDVGIGGRVAEVVGTRLHKLGKNAQILCITHQPQVAAQGDQHILIDKVSDHAETYSTLIKLSDEMRVAELARMLGGEVITERTIAHAQELLHKG